MWCVSDTLYSYRSRKRYCIRTANLIRLKFINIDFFFTISCLNIDIMHLDIATFNFINIHSNSQSRSKIYSSYELHKSSDYKLFPSTIITNGLNSYPLIMGNKMHVYKCIVLCKWICNHELCIYVAKRS